LLAIPFPAIDPVLVQIGPFAVRWYALSYIVGILLGWWYSKRLGCNSALWRPSGPPLNPTALDGFVFWATLGIILGGRLGYVVIYDLPRFLANPAEILASWHGGSLLPGGLPRMDARVD